MTTAQVVETSVTVNNNSPIQDYVHLDDQTQPFEMTPGFKPFTMFSLSSSLLLKLCNISLSGGVSVTVRVWSNEVPTVVVFTKNFV